jgi:Flp pilus assembly protein TadD
VGRTLLQAGEIEPALEHLRRAVEIDPGRAHHHHALGIAEERLGRNDAAASRYSEAIRLDPRHAGAHGNLGMLRLDQGRSDEAVALLELALRFDPNSVTTRNNLAWLLATSGDPTLRDPERAVRLAEEAREAEGDGDPELLDTLAAAYASVGRFEDAARIAARAAEGAEALGDLEGARRMRGSERRYREGRASGEAPKRR